VKEIRRADVGGKELVFTITTGKPKKTEWICASTSTQYNTWLNTFKDIKE